MSVNAPEVLFWQCPVKDHTAVRWEGSIACCEICGMSSVLTEELINRGRADQRQRDIQWFRVLATKVLTARDVPGNGDVIMGVPALPASILARAATLLEECPIGAAEN